MAIEIMRLSKPMAGKLARQERDDRMEPFAAADGEPAARDAERLFRNGAAAVELELDGAAVLGVGDGRLERRVRCRRAAVGDRDFRHGGDGRGLPRRSPGGLRSERRLPVGRLGGLREELRDRAAKDPAEAGAGRPRTALDGSVATGDRRIGAAVSRDFRAGAVGDLGSRRVHSVRGSAGRGSRRAGGR